MVTQHTKIIIDTIDNLDTGESITVAKLIFNGEESAVVYNAKEFKFSINRDLDAPDHRMIDLTFKGESGVTYQ